MSAPIPPWEEPEHRCHADVPQEEAGDLWPCDRCKRFYKEYVKQIVFTRPGWSVTLKL